MSETAAAVPVCFTTYFEGSLSAHTSLEEWFVEQACFDDPDDCYDILACLRRNGHTEWAGIDFRLVERDEFERQFARIPDPLAEDDGETFRAWCRQHGIQR